MEWEKYSGADFELKELVESEEFYEFKGYASIFDVPDKVNDIVERGAFKRSIDHHDGWFPIAFMHNKLELIGRGKVEEDHKGLFVKEGKLVKGIPRADQVYKLMKAKVVDGMSFSYRAVQKVYRQKFRHLKELAVGELTLGPKSMICHPQALVTAIKHEEAVDRIINEFMGDLTSIVGSKLWEDNPDFAEIRYKTREPDTFSQLKAWWLEEGSIQAVGGPLKNDDQGVKIQELRFVKTKDWTLGKAKQWASEHPDIKFYETVGTLSFAMSIDEVKIEPVA